MHTYYSTHGYGVVIESTYLAEEVPGSHPDRTILKTLTLVPTALVFGVSHINVRVITLSR